MAFEEGVTFHGGEVKLLPVAEGRSTIPAAAGLGVKDRSPVWNAEDRGGILRGIKRLRKERRRGVADNGGGKERSRLGRDGKGNFLAPCESNPSGRGMEVRG